MRSSTRPRPPWAADAVIALASAAAIALIVAGLRVLQPSPNPTIAALLLLLVVLGAATGARRPVAMAVSVAAMLAFNFFLLPPFHTFSIADPQDWMALFVFLAVAAITVERAQFLAERKKTEAAHQRADLASALLASFSHDLRTPVTSIRVAVSNLQDAGLSTAEREAQSQVAMRELERLTRLFENILDLARIDAGAIDPLRQWVAPADLVEAAVAYVGPPLVDRMLHIEADTSHVIHLDPRLTSSALAHVLENAVRYSPAGEPIEVRAWAGPDGVHLVVRDHGAGVEPADLERMFEPFYRGAKAGRGSGTGLGLAITRGLLAAEGGRVSCENVAGGAQFTIAVPAPVRAVKGAAP